MKAIASFTLFVFALSCQVVSVAEKDSGFAANESRIPGSKVNIDWSVDRPDGIYDFVLRNNHLVAPIQGIRDSTNQLFELDLTDRSPKMSSIEIPDVEWEQIAAIALFQSDLWAVTKNGIVLRNPSETAKWETVAKVEMAEPAFIAFADRRTGFLGGNIFSKKDLGAQIYKTEDGGQSWTEVFENKSSGNISDWEVIDANRVLVAMNNEYLLITSDGGKTWVPNGLDREINGFEKILAKNETGAKDIVKSYDQSYWVVGEKGAMFRSTDNGTTWNGQSLDKSKNLASIAFSEEGKGVVVGRSGLIMISNDFGRNWDQVAFESGDSVPQGDNLSSQDFLKVRNTGKAFIVLGTKGIYRVLIR